MELEKEILEHIRIVEDFPEKGISFKDFTPIFRNPKLSKKIIVAMADPYRGKVNTVCGIESRGFILGYAIALELEVPFVLVRKAGKLPPPVETVDYALEYGTASLEIVKGHIHKDSKVLIHDDVLATGGTADACAQLIQRLGGSIQGFSFLISLGLPNSEEHLLKYSTIHSLIQY